MANDFKRIIDLVRAESLDDDAEFEICRPDANATDGYTSRKLKMSAISTKVISDGIDDTTSSASSLYSSSKIDALLLALETALTPVVVTGTLTTGSTSITLNNANITSNSTIFVYTDVFGLYPTNISVSTGSVTLTFAEQSVDVGIKVEVK